MLGKLTGWDDTIVALATAPGVSAIGVIRLSGPKAIDIAGSLLPSKDISKQPSHTIHFGTLKENGKPLDEAVISLYRAPHSYTGEEVAEISGHGSPFVLQQIIEACVRKGARLAKPGEFTQRAFLNGKIDLTQAEAVADIIASNTIASQKAAIHNIRGGFSSDLKVLREQLIKFSALIELELDFSQEDVQFADRNQLYELVHQTRQSVLQLLQSFQLGNVIRNGVSVAIIGKPNAGKSTLLNALLNENRAIVSDIPGTTRDTIEEVVNIDGILFRLIDTAGIRKHTSDVIESAGMERSMEKMRQADLVLYLFDVVDAREDVALMRSEIEKLKLDYLLVGNKIDQGDQEDIQKTFGDWERLVLISAKQNLHTNLLKERMVEVILKGQVQTESTVVTNTRHYHALTEVERSLEDIKNGLDNMLPGDLLASDIRRCLHYLGEITGEVTNEDQLDYIFSKFCIGK